MTKVFKISLYLPKYIFLIKKLQCFFCKISPWECLLFTILHLFETRESIIRNVDHGGQIVLW